MALDYALIIPGRNSAEELWPRLYGTSHAPPQPSVRKGVWTADERERFGYIITLHRGRHGYYDLGDWLRKPDEFLHVGFRADKDQSPQRRARILLELVQNVLDSGDEDMWLSFNGEQLILERTGGQVRRSQAGFWNNLIGAYARLTLRLRGCAGGQRRERAERRRRGAAAWAGA